MTLRSYQVLRRFGDSSVSSDTTIIYVDSKDESKV
jgi:hypothetical protein